MDPLSTWACCTNIRARLSDHPWFLLQTKATNTTGDTNGGAFMQPLVCVRECLCTCWCKTCVSAGEYVQVSMYRWVCIFLHRCPCKWALETLHTLFVLHLMLCLFLYPGRVWSPWREIDRERERVSERERDFFPTGFTTVLRLQFLTTGDCAHWWWNFFYFYFFVMLRFWRRLTQHMQPFYAQP